MNKNEDFFNFLIFNGFLIQFLNMSSRVTTFCSAKVLSQEESRFVDRVCKVKKKLIFSVETL
jgi:hypothetical protein